MTSTGAGALEITTYAAEPGRDPWPSASGRDCQTGVVSADQRCRRLSDVSSNHGEFHRSVLLERRHRTLHRLMSLGLAILQSVCGDWTPRPSAEGVISRLLWERTLVTGLVNDRHVGVAEHLEPAT